MTVLRKLQRTRNRKTHMDLSHTLEPHKPSLWKADSFPMFQSRLGAPSPTASRRHLPKQLREHPAWPHRKWPVRWTIATFEGKSGRFYNFYIPPSDHPTRTYFGLISGDRSISWQFMVLLGSIQSAIVSFDCLAGFNLYSLVRICLESCTCSHQKQSEEFWSRWLCWTWEVGSNACFETMLDALHSSRK